MEVSIEDPAPQAGLSVAENRHLMLKTFNYGFDLNNFFC
jgi:hypothetical protein